jgi:hypothetical protein
MLCGGRENLTIEPTAHALVRMEHFARYFEYIGNDIATHDHVHHQNVRETAFGPEVTALIALLTECYSWLHERFKSTTKPRLHNLQAISINTRSTKTDYL